MKFKVNLIKRIVKSEEENKFSLVSLFEDIKRRFDIFRWGLQPALAGEHIMKIRLNRKELQNAPGYNHELNLFDNSYRTKFDLIFSGLKAKLAVGGVGLMAMGAMIGAVTDKAEAAINNVNPPAMEAVKSNTPVMLAGLDAVAPTALALDEYSKSPFKLAYWHNNVGTHTNTAHTNTQWQNSVTHNNVNWDDSSYSHSNAWQNTPHSDLPPVDHTNVAGGTLPQDYLY